MSGSGPIYEYQREVTERLEQAIRERDEARNEVERLRNSLWRCEEILKTMLEKWTKPAFERGEHLPSLRAQLEVVSDMLNGSLHPLFDPVHKRVEARQAAYRRGAEAMREAILAAWTVKNSFNDIRTMSIPEDKQC